MFRGAEQKFQQVCERAVAGLERLAVPGVALGILHQGEEYTAGFGVTSVEHPLAVTDDTLFQIGSITKTYTATAAMRLVDMGKLDLDAPLRTYLPDLRLADETVAARVSLRHLLTHTGGWVGDYFDDLGSGADALAKIVSRLAGLPQITPLGAIWSYSNSGFYLAGRLIEVITGQAYETALQELVFDPLGLTQSFFFAHDVITHRFAVGHSAADKQPKVARPWAVGRAIHPVGGIVCSVRDLLRYARFHLGDGAAPDGTRLLSPQSLALMQTPLVPSTGISMCGLSWSIVTVDGKKMLRHGGGTKGQETELKLVPADGLAVAILTNSNTGDALCNELGALALESYSGFKLPEASPLDLAEEQLAPYVGCYSSALNVCDIELQDRGLVLKVTDKGGFPTPDTPPLSQPPPVRLAFYAPDKTVVLDEPFQSSRGEFLRNPDGGLAWYRFSGRVHARDQDPE